MSLAGEGDRVAVEGTSSIQLDSEPQKLEMARGNGPSLGRSVLDVVDNGERERRLPLKPYRAAAAEENASQAGYQD